WTRRCRASGGSPSRCRGFRPFPPFLLLPSPGGGVHHHRTLGRRCLLPVPAIEVPGHGGPLRAEIGDVWSDDRLADDVVELLLVHLQVFEEKAQGRRLPALVLVDEA